MRIPVLLAILVLLLPAPGSDAVGAAPKRGNFTSRTSKRRPAEAMRAQSVAENVILCAVGPWHRFAAGQSLSRRSLDLLGDAFLPLPQHLSVRLR